MVQTMKILTLKIIYEDSNIVSTVIYFCITLNLVHKVYNRIRTDTMTLINIGRAREVFHGGVIFFTRDATYVTI